MNLSTPRKALKKARLAKKWTQQQAAEAVGYAGYSSWAMVETGRVTPPVKQMLLIARKLEVKPSDIWEELREEDGDHGPAA